MPRKPTGNPRGRPPGTGRLTAPTRITVWLPGELYTRLEAFAEGRSYTRGTPELARCVRDALEHYLACPYKRQTGNIPLPRLDNKTADSKADSTATAPLFDTSKYVLGKLCPRGHEHGTTGQSLLRISNRHCLACDREKFHERKQAKRQAQPA